MQNKNQKKTYEEPNTEVIVFDQPLMTLVEVSAIDGVDKPVTGGMDLSV